MKNTMLTKSITTLLVVLAVSLAVRTNIAANAESSLSSAADGKLVFGKYGCTASKYRNGSYEYIPRGSFVISKDGKYAYNGFEQPSKGTFTVTDAGAIQFKGGYLDGGEATPIDRPNKFFLVFPTIPDNRWTCGLAD